MTTPVRNVDVDPSAPLTEWPYEALVVLVERGTIRDWARIVSAITDEPWGVVARQVEEYLSYESPVGVGPLLERAIARSRREAQEAERAAVAAHVTDLVTRSGLTSAEFASRIGTSRTRLSTYRNGRVSPSAALVHRMEQLVSRLRDA